MTTILISTYTGPEFELDVSKISDMNEPSLPSLERDEAPARDLSNLFSDAVAAGAVAVPEGLVALLNDSDGYDETSVQAAVYAADNPGGPTIGGRWERVRNILPDGLTKGMDEEDLRENPEALIHTLQELVASFNQLLRSCASA